MAHQRTTIRNALKAMLTGTTAAGTSVYANRAFNLDKAKLPTIHIYNDPETISDRTMGNQRLLCKSIIKIDLTVANSSNVDTVLDDLCKEVEDIIKEDRRLQGTCSASQYTGMEPQFDPAEKTIGRATLTYEITYLT